MLIAKKYHALFPTLVASLSLSACIKGNNKFLSQKDNANLASVATEQGSDGQTIARLSSKLNSEQVVQGAGDTAKVAVSFPPGSLAVNTTISMEIGDNLVSNATKQDLLLDNGTQLKIASVPYNVSSSVPTDAAAPYTISIPVSSPSLRLLADDTDNLAVIYQVVRQADSTMYKGIIPSKDIVTRDGYAYFATKYFGTFQLAYTNKVIEAPKEVVTTTPILTKSAIKTLENFSLQEIKLIYQADAKVFSFNAGADGFKSAGASCWVFLDKDKTAPFDQQVKITETLSGKLTVDTTAAGTYFAKYECSNGNGRFAESTWSNSVVVPVQQTQTVTTPVVVPPSITVTSPVANAALNTPMIAFSGTCTGENLAINLVFGTVQGTATCTNGTWSSTLNFSSVNEGSALVAITATNATGKANTSVSINIDRTTPTFTMTTPTEGTLYNNSEITTVTFAGTCSETGATLIFSGATTGSVSCTSSTWTKTFNLAALADGSHNITVKIVDAAGNASATQSRGFSKDATLPTLTISSPAPGTYVNAATQSAVTISGTCSENSRSINLTSPVAATVICTSGAWSKTVDVSSIADSNITFSFNHTDAAGNITTASRTVTKDTSQPTATITTPTGSYINQSDASSFHISGTCSENGRPVNLTSPITASQTCSGGAWATVLNITNLADGNKTFTIEHTDAAGNTVAINKYLTKDTVTPTVSFNTPAPNTFINASQVSTVTFSGNCSEDGQTVTLGSPLSVSAPCNSGLWSITTSVSAVADGNLTVTASLTDAAGNTGTGSISVIKDATVPTVTISGPAENTYVNANSAGAFTLSGTCSENSHPVTLTGSASGSTACTSGNWAITVNLSSVPDGTLSLTATTSDTAGNPATPTTRTFYKDVVAPPPLDSFQASPSVNFGEMLLTLGFPSNKADYLKFKVMGIMGMTPPSDCNSGQTFIAFSSNFTDRTVSIPGLTMGTKYSLRVCVYDPASNITMSNTVAGIYAGSLTMFASSGMFSGNFSAPFNGQSFSTGLFGADYRCQQMALDNNMPGYWRALLSDNTNPVKDRLKFNSPILTPSGNLIADPGTALFNGALAGKANVDETGTTIIQGVDQTFAWTGSAEDGTQGYPMANCSNWTTNGSSTYGRVGDSDSLSGTWTNSCYNSVSCGCNQILRLYCVNQVTNSLKDFSVTQGPQIEKLTIHVAFPVDISSFQRVEIRGMTGLTPPNTDCSNGTSYANLTNFTSPFNAPFTFTAGSTNSFRACVFGQDGLVHSSYVVAGVIAPTGTHTLFATSNMYNGNLGGLAGADAKCNAAATTANLTGNYKALLSDSSSPASSRLAFFGPIVNTSGQPLANSGADLYDGTLQNPIRTEYNLPPSASQAWAGTNSGGGSVASNCANWTSSTPSSPTGGLSAISAYSTPSWIASATGDCSTANALYCVSQ